MAKENPETLLTRWFRQQLESRGAWTQKRSDNFTRGVLDLGVMSDRWVETELKIGERAYRTEQRTWKRLGLSGAQDQSVREIARRNSKCTAVITGATSAPHETVALWLPAEPAVVHPDARYVAVACGIAGVLEWYGLARVTEVPDDHDF